MSPLPGSEGWGVVDSWKVVEDLVAAAPMWSFVDFGQGSLVCGGQACKRLGSNWFALQCI